MSGKADSLAQKFGANIGQTIAMRPGQGGGAESPPPAADKYAGAVKSRAFADLPISAVDRDDSQPREEFDEADLSRLANSIRRFGQLAPIRVRPAAEPGRWVVLVGERRLRACRLAGLERIRVEFVERPMTEADVLAEQVVENVARADLRPVEEGRAYRRLMDLNGWTADELAETLGVEPTSVYHRLGLLRLPDDVADRVDAGEIKATAAYEISKLPAEDEQRAVAAKVVAEGLDFKATAEEVRRRKDRGKVKGRGAKAKPRKVTSRTLRTSVGRITIENSRTGLTLAAMLVGLKEAVETIERELIEQESRGEAA